MWGARKNMECGVRKNLEPRLLGHAEIPVSFSDSGTQEILSARFRSTFKGAPKGAKFIEPQGKDYNYVDPCIYLPSQKKKKVEVWAVCQDYCSLGQTCQPSTKRQAHRVHQPAFWLAERRSVASPLRFHLATCVAASKYIEKGNQRKPWVCETDDAWQLSTPFTSQDVPSLAWPHARCTQHVVGNLGSEANRKQKYYASKGRAPYTYPSPLWRWLSIEVPYILSTLLSDRA